VGSPRVALDGIILETSTSDELSGKVWWEDGWYRFKFRYDDMRFEREFLTEDWYAFSDPSV
jgi:hypothetical protein